MKMTKKVTNSEPKKKTTRTTTHVCSGCLKDFKPKEIFIAQADSKDHSTLYCQKCLDKLEIKEFSPYNVSRKMTDKETIKKPVKKTVKKTPEKSTVKKTTRKTVKK